MSLFCCCGLLRWLVVNVRVVVVVVFVLEFVVVLWLKCLVRQLQVAIGSLFVVVLRVYVFVCVYVVECVVCVVCCVVLCCVLLVCWCVGERACVRIGV